MINFIIPIVPKAQARTKAGVNPHTGKAQVFTPSAQRRNQNDLIALMAQYAPARPMGGPLRLKVHVFLPVPKSWSKKKQADAMNHAKRPTSVPDLDNCIKMVMDCMTKLRFWNDDAQVVEIEAFKAYAERTCWLIELNEILLPARVVAKE